MAASSSCNENNWHQYDVFLSFSGEDTRRNFVDHLNEALKGRGIRTFKDDERLEKGKEIKEELLKSIDESSFCIIIFSKKYASSSWCLDELVRIMECHKTAYQTAFPVFYDVEPTEVRKQSGSVGEAFAKHTKKKVVVGRTLTRNVGKALVKHSKKQLGKWRKALKDAANLSGWELKNTAHGHEAKVIKLIVERISLELRSINMDNDENLVGMEQRMQDLDSSLDIGSNDVRMIGIKGMGGVGKTTLARAIFNRISFNFEGKSFVENVRENSKPSLLGLKKLQEQILRDVLNDRTITVSSVHEGTNLIKTMLHGKRILVVLDDVDREDQLEELAGDPSWFKSGSRIIITTRDLRVLNTYTVKWIHDVNLLSDEEAIHLFCRHAFKKNSPTQEYERQSHEVVSYAGGLPLTLKVLGSHLRDRKKCEWKDAVARLKTIPLNETLKVLELSYEGLEDDYKEIFLDVACVLRHLDKDEAIIALGSCGFHAINGLRVLEEKSLLKIVGTFRGGEIHMHDHIVEMGENIVRREHPDKPEKHSRLWVQEEIEHVLANGLVNEETRCIYLNFTNDFVLEGFKNMKRLRCLIAYKQGGHFSYEHKESSCFPNSLRYICCYGYPYWYLPNTFEAHNLVGLNMCSSSIKQLWTGGKVMKKLKFLDLNFSMLKSLDLGLAPSLERLNLSYCIDLVDLNVHGGCLKSLIYLNLQGCRRLKSFLFIEQLESLEVLYINELNLSESPYYIITRHSNNTLLHLHLSNDDNIVEIPASVGNLHKLVSLFVDNCKRLKGLPGSICSLQHLKTLDLQNTGIEELPKDIGQLECLQNLYLSSTYVKHLPPSICMLKRLKTLLLTCCYYLEKLPEDIGHLESLVELNLQGCKELRDIPNSVCKLKHLKELTLKGCRGLEKLPDNLGDLECLQLLNIQDTWIMHLPHSIYLLKGLKIIDDGFTRLFSKYDSQKHQIQIFQHLKTLDFRRQKIEELPEALGYLECLEELNLSHTNVKHLPDSIYMLKHLKKLVLRRCVLLDKLPDDVGQLESLEVLDLSRCYNMREIPDSVCMMKQLKILSLWHCFCLNKLPADVGQLESLEELYITRSYNIREIPSSICMLKHLKKLELEGCGLLEKLPENVGQLESLEVLDLASCNSIREVPNSIGMLKHLKFLALHGCRKLNNLPDEVGDLECLQELTIWDTGITHLPQSISLLNGLKIYTKSR